MLLSEVKAGDLLIAYKNAPEWGILKNETYTVSHVYKQQLTFYTYYISIYIELCSCEKFVKITLQDFCDIFNIVNDVTKQKRMALDHFDSLCYNYILHDKRIVEDTMYKNIFHKGFTPKKVIFNDPATIVIWNDGTKTVVKRREGEIDDKEKAVMYCILKKMCGSKSNMDKYLKTFLKEA